MTEPITITSAQSRVLEFTGRWDTMVFVPLRIITGFLLVFLGLLGLIIPVLPGFIFIIPGLALLSRHFHWARRGLRLARAARLYCRRKFRRRRLTPTPYSGNVTP